MATALLYSCIERLLAEEQHVFQRIGKPSYVYKVTVAFKGIVVHQENDVQSDFDKNFIAFLYPIKQ